jgi:hypothetical protein
LLKTCITSILLLQDRDSGTGGCSEALTMHTAWRGFSESDGQFGSGSNEVLDGRWWMHSSHQFNCGDEVGVAHLDIFVNGRYVDSGKRWVPFVALRSYAPRRTTLEGEST